MGSREALRASGAGGRLRARPFSAIWQLPCKPGKGWHRADVAITQRQSDCVACLAISGTLGFSNTLTQKCRSCVCRLPLQQAGKPQGPKYPSNRALGAQNHLDYNMWSLKPHNENLVPFRKGSAGTHSFSSAYQKLWPSGTPLLPQACWLLVVRNEGMENKLEATMLLDAI